MYAVPTGLLLGTLLVFGRLSADNEITAMRTSGRSILQIGRSVLALAVLGVIASLYINFYLMPQSRVDYHAKLDKTIQESAHNFFLPRTFIREFREKGIIVYFDSSEPGKDEGMVVQNLWLWFLDKQQRVTAILHADVATAEFDDVAGSITLLPKISTGESRDSDDPENPVRHGMIGKWEGDRKIVLPLTGVFGQRDISKKIDWLTLPQLLARRRFLAETNADPVAQLKVAFTIQEKLTFALAGFAFVIVAIPLGIRTQRKESSVNLALATLLVVAYYVGTISISWLDKRPDLHPEILIWLPNIVFIAIGVWLLRRVERA